MVWSDRHDCCTASKRINQSAHYQLIMANLYQIYSNLAIGGVVSLVCFIAFGISVGLECNNNLTLRAWARPIKVIKNYLNKPYCLSWIYWSMSLRYINILSGILGTGTCDEGSSGPNLWTNLDGFVLLRYHVLQFKVRNTKNKSNYEIIHEPRKRVQNGGENNNMGSQFCLHFCFYVSELCIYFGGYTFFSSCNSIGHNNVYSLVLHKSMRPTGERRECLQGNR